MNQVRYVAVVWADCEATCPASPSAGRKRPASRASESMTVKMSNCCTSTGQPRATTWRQVGRSLSRGDGAGPPASVVGMGEVGSGGGRRRGVAEHRPLGTVRHGEAVAREQLAARLRLAGAVDGDAAGADEVLGLAAAVGQA